MTKRIHNISNTMKIIFRIVLLPIFLIAMFFDWIVMNDGDYEDWLKEWISGE